MLRLCPLSRRRVGPRRLTANPYEERGIVERKAEMLISRWVSPGYLRTTKSSIFARVVVLAAVCRGVRVLVLADVRTRTHECEPSLRRCLSTFASIACATTRGPRGVQERRFNASRKSFQIVLSYLPNDISARERLFCGDGLPTVDRIIYSTISRNFQHGHRARRGIARLADGGRGD